MAACNVLQASVLPGRIVEANPASEMSKGLSSRPIGIVLMPGHNSAMMRRFAEELVVPEANCSAKKLRGWGCKCRMPEEIVKPWRYAPCAQRMEQHVIGIAGLIRVIFVK